MHYFEYEQLTNMPQGRPKNNTNNSYVHFPMNRRSLTGSNIYNSIKVLQLLHDQIEFGYKHGPFTHNSSIKSVDVFHDLSTHLFVVSDMGIYIYIYTQNVQNTQHYTGVHT